MFQPLIFRDVPKSVVILVPEFGEFGAGLKLVKRDRLIPGTPNNQFL